MARRLRLQFPGARYHVINRGNYRHDVFSSVGAVRAFEIALEEAATRHGWLLHAYVVMRNHYHLALETPQPNLVEGMHWLQSTFATRFNRFRGERGHLFQGRYQALLIEDAAHLVRVINYIHLNPVRAGLVTALQAVNFRWSSLRRLARPPRPPWLSAETLLSHLEFADNRTGWTRYFDQLGDLAARASREQDDEATILTSGWAVGSAAWQKTVAHQQVHLASEIGIAANELRIFKEARWATELQSALAEAGKTNEDIARDAKGVPWKIAIARRLRCTVAAPNRWLASALNMGCAASVRAHTSRRFSF